MSSDNLNLNMNWQKWLGRSQKILTQLLEISLYRLAASHFISKLQCLVEDLRIQNLHHYAQNSTTFGSYSCQNTSSTISRCHQPLNSPHTFSGSWYAVVDDILLVSCNPDSPVYWGVIVHAGLSKEKGVWRRTRCAAIAKLKNSSDPAAYAHS